MNGAHKSGEKMPGASGDLPPCSTEKAGCVSGRGPHSVARAAYVVWLIGAVSIVLGFGIVWGALWPHSAWPLAVEFPLCVILGIANGILRERWLG